MISVSKLTRVCDLCGEELVGADVFRLCTLSNERWCTIAEKGLILSEYAKLESIVTQCSKKAAFPSAFPVMAEMIKKMSPRLRTLVFYEQNALSDSIIMSIMYARSYSGRWTRASKTRPSARIDSQETINAIRYISPIVYANVGWLSCVYVDRLGNYCDADAIGGVVCEDHATHLIGTARQCRTHLHKQLVGLIMEYIFEGYGLLFSDKN